MDDSGGFGAPPPPPPPGAGGGGSIPQRGLGDILSVAFEVYKANAAKLIQIVAIVVIPLTFIMALLTQVAFKQHCDAAHVNSLSDLANNCTVSFGRSLLISAITYFIAVAIQQLLIGALTRAPGPGRTQVREALGGTESFESVTGPVAWHDRQARRRVFLLRLHRERATPAQTFPAEE